MPVMAQNGNRGEMRVRLLGVGAAAPDTRVPNSKLEVRRAPNEHAWLILNTRYLNDEL